MLTTEDLILCHGQAQTVLLPDDFFMLRVFGSNSWDITTYLGLFILGLDQKPYTSCGDNFSVFLVLRSAGAATRSSCGSRIALKEEVSENRSQTSV